MKYDWKKEEKDNYLPKEEPSLITIKAMPFFIIDGKGNPNTSDEFKEVVEALYSLSYTIKMLPKKGIIPDGYYDYTVFPLEGIWDMDIMPDDFNKLDKDHFIYSLMIRQPDFVTNELAADAINMVKKKKKLALLDKVRFEKIEDGSCVEMMHIGSFDEEPKSFTLMKKFCEDNNLERISHTHREIYLSDLRKTPSDKLKTVLRFMVKYKK